MTTTQYDGTRLPAKPLASMIDRLFAQAHGDDSGNEARALRGVMYEQLGVNQRRLYEWRNLPRTSVQFNVADRILTSSPYNWFDVWPECPLDAEHEVAVMDTGSCARCQAYEKARHAFTGQRPARKAAGMCVRCGGPTLTRGAKRCKACANKGRS